MKDASTQFEQADWKTLTPLLLKHALRCVSQYRWSTTADSLPQGQGLEDLVFGAIQKTLEHIRTGQTGKGSRTWNPAEIDLLTHLRGVIRSDVNTLVNLEEHKKREYRAHDVLDVEENQHPVDHLLDSNLSHEQVRLEEDRAKELYEKLIENLRADFAKEALVVKYLNAVENIILDGREPSYDAIMKEGKLTFNDVRNSKRKVERAVTRMRKNTRGANEK